MAGEPYNKDDSNINKGCLRSDSRGMMTST